MFNMGQRVWSFTNGWGEVIYVTDSKLYPVTVKFDNLSKDGIARIETYTSDGKCDNSQYRTLFYDEIPIPIECLDPKAWRAMDGGVYYAIYIDRVSGAYYDIEIDTKTEVDDKMYLSGNYFRNKEEAQEAVDKINEIFNNNKVKNNAR